MEKKVLLKIIELNSTTNAELAESIGKQRQHISLYLKKLEYIQAIKLDRIDGTRRFYIPSTEALWLKFRTDIKEVKMQKAKDEKKVENFRQSLSDFIK